MHSAEKRHDRVAEKIASKAPVVRHNRLPRPKRYSNAHTLQLKHVGRAVMLPSGTMFATTASDEVGVSIWDMHPKPVRRHMLEAGVVDWTSMAAIGDDLLVTANSEGDVFTWRVSSGETIAHYSIGPRKCDALIACSGLVVLVDERGRFVLLKHEPDGSEIRLVSRFYARRTEEGFFLKSHGNIFISSGPSTIAVYDASRQCCLGRLPIPEPDDRGYYYTDIDRTHIVCTRGVRVHVHAREKHFPLRRVIELPSSDVTAIKLLGWDRMLVADASDAALALIRISTGEVMQRMRLPFNEVYSIDISADARLLVASYDEVQGVAVLHPPRGSSIHRDVELYARRHYGKKFVRRRCVRQNRTRRGATVAVAAAMLVGTLAKLLV